MNLIKKYIKEFWNSGKNTSDSGVVINQFHKNRLCSLLKDHDGIVICGNPNAAVDLKLEPTVILNPSLSSPIMKEEIFGPILPVLTFKDFSEAVTII